MFWPSPSKTANREMRDHFRLLVPQQANYDSQNHDLFIIMIIMIVLTAMITILVPQLHFAQNELLEEFWTTSDWVEKMMFEKKDSRTWEIIKDLLDLVVVSSERQSLCRLGGWQWWLKSRLVANLSCTAKETGKMTMLAAEGARRSSSPGSDRAAGGWREVSSYSSSAPPATIFCHRARAFLQPLPMQVCLPPTEKQNQPLQSAGEPHPCLCSYPPTFVIEQGDVIFPFTCVGMMEMMCGQ